MRNSHVSNITSRRVHITRLIRPRFMSTRCAVIGRSHGKLGRFTAHEPVRCGCDQSRSALTGQTKWGQCRDDMTRDEVSWSDINSTRCCTKSVVCGLLAVHVVMVVRTLVVGNSHCYQLRDCALARSYALMRLTCYC